MCKQTLVHVESQVEHQGKTLFLMSTHCCSWEVATPLLLTHKASLPRVSMAAYATWFTMARLDLFHTCDFHHMLHPVCRCNEVLKHFDYLMLIFVDHLNFEVDFVAVRKLRLYLIYSCISLSFMTCTTKRPQLSTLVLMAAHARMNTACKENMAAQVAVGSMAFVQAATGIEER